MNNPKLLPCKNCGQCTSADVVTDEDQIVAMTCFACGYCTGRCNTTAETYAAWNRRAPGWQAMDTAPKDGTYILTYSMQSICLVQAARWDKTGTWRNVYDMMLDPDAWQPLPAAPEGE